jgi:hypothetical protein
VAEILLEAVEEVLGGILGRELRVSREAYRIFFQGLKPYRLNMSAPGLKLRLPKEVAGALKSSAKSGSWTSYRI